MKSIYHLQIQINQIATSKGFWNNRNINDVNTLLSILALIHSEVSESVECVRDGKLIEYENENGKPEGLPTELADIVIRVFDFAYALGINLESVIDRKIKYNETRPFLHGKLA